MKKTILIVKSNLDDFRKAKQEMIENEERKKQLLKYSDYAVETKTKLFIFKAIPLPTNIPGLLTGYDEVEANGFMTDLYKFVKEIEQICAVRTTVNPQTPPEARNGSPRNDTTETVANNPNELKKTGN